MEAVIFIGLQASGKSTFCMRRFFRTHVRINLDMLKTKHRERLLLDACLAGKQPFVIDKVNAAAIDRATYIQAAKAAGFQVVGYYFRWRSADAARNALNGHCYWLLRKQGLGEKAATEQLWGMPSSAKHELLFGNGVNFNDLPNWQKRGVGLYWEQFEKIGTNPVTGQSVVAQRRRIKHDFDLPMKDEYGQFVAVLVCGDGT